MDQIEFRRLVRNGHGRAVLHLQRSDPEPYVTIILDSCRTDDCYDRQVNGGRTHFHWELITSAGIEARAFDYLIEEFRTHPEPPYWIVSLVQRFAEAGFPEALPFLWTVLDRDPASHSAVQALISLEGFASIDRIERAIAPFPVDDWGAYERAVDLIRYVEQTDRVANAGTDLDRNVQPSIDRLQARIAEYRRIAKEKRVAKAADPSRQRLKDPAVVPFSDVWSSVEDQIPAGRIRSTTIQTSYGYTTYRDWGKHAPEVEIEHAAHELAARSPTDVLHFGRYGQIFSERRYPLDPATFVACVLLHIDAAGDDYWNDAAGWAVHCCLWSLSLIDDLGYDDLARMLRGRDDHWRGYWPLLCPTDAGSEFIGLLADSINREDDEEILHSLGANLVRRAENNLLSGFIKPLKKLYEKTPCAHCRWDAVKLLHQLNALSDRMIEECRHDSHEWTRELAISNQGPI